MEPFFSFFIKFQGYLIGVICIYGNIMSMCYGHFALHYSYEDFFDYRYMGKTAIFFNLVWISVGLCTIYAVYKEIKQLLFPFAIMFTMDLFLLTLRDIVIIWIDHPWAEVNLLSPFAAPQIIYGSLHAMMALVVMGKLFQHEISSKSGPNFIQLNAEPNVANELAEEESVVLTE